MVGNTVVPSPQVRGDELLETSPHVMGDDFPSFSLPQCYDRSTDLSPRDAPLANLGVDRLKKDADTKVVSKTSVPERRVRGEGRPRTSPKHIEQDVRSFSSTQHYDRYTELAPRGARLANLGV